MPSKTIKFDYFQLTTPKDIGKEVIFPSIEISPYLEDLSKINRKKRTCKVSYDEVILQVLEKTPDKLWKMQFIRVRKDLLPGIVKDNGDFDKMPLDDDEYVGEDISVLYDPTRCIIMIQRNRNSITPTAVIDYFNTIQREHQIVHSILPIKDLFSKMNRNQIFKKVDINFVDIKKDINANTKSVGSVIDIANHINAAQAHVTFSVGKRKEPLNRRVYDELKKLMDYSNNNKGIKKLEVSVQEDPESKVEVYDLVEAKLFDTVNITYSRSEPITHERIFTYMLDKYIDRRPAIDTIIGRK